MRRKGVYFYADTIVLLRKIVLATCEKKARANKGQKIFYHKIRHYTRYVDSYTKPWIKKSRPVRFRKTTLLTSNVPIHYHQVQYGTVQGNVSSLFFVFLIICTYRYVQVRTFLQKQWRISTIFAYLFKIKKNVRTFVHLLSLYHTDVPQYTTLEYIYITYDSVAWTYFL